MSRNLPHDWFPRPLPSNVELGEGAWLYSSYAFLHFQSREPRAVVIGDHSGVYKPSFFEIGPHGSVSIGRYSTVVSAIIVTNGRVTIGNYCFIAHEVVIADTALACPPRSDAASDRLSFIEIGDTVWVGANATILAGAKIGAGSVIGAGAVVDFEVPENSIVAGNPARIVGSAKRPAQRGPASSIRRFKTESESK